MVTVVLGERPPELEAELLVADPDARTVRCWHLADGAYVEQPASALLDVAMSTLESEVDWPR